LLVEQDYVYVRYNIDERSFERPYLFSVSQVAIVKVVRCQYTVLLVWWSPWHRHTAVVHSQSLDARWSARNWN